MKLPGEKLDFSKLALFISIAWILAVGLFYYPKWKYTDTEATLGWDVSGYYFYLPSVFIYHDLKEQKFKDPLLEKYKPTTSPYQSYRYKNGNWVMKYSAGMAVMYSPFFFTAHLLAKPLGYEADGFSYPYQLAIGLGSLLIALIGLIFLRKIVRSYFSAGVTGIVLLLYVFGTNYLEYAAISGAMSHNYLFTLYTVLTWLTIQFYRRPTYRKAVGIGLLVGLATLTRPTEIISGAIPLLWAIGSIKDVDQRLKFFIRQRSKLLVAFFCFLAVCSLQLVYWKYVSGHWLVYSYQAERIQFLHPHIYKCLLSFRKGWFVYTPMMLLVIPGFYFLFKTRRNIFWVSFLFSVVFLYLCFSWSIWWYAGSVGQRAMVQCYPILAFPIAAVVEKIMERRWRLIIALPVFVLFSYYNVWLTHEAHKGGLLDPENMTKAYWKKILLHYTVPEDAKKLLDTDEEFEGERKNVQVVFQTADIMELDSSRQFSKPYEIDIAKGKYKWLRAEAVFSIAEKEWNVWKMTQMAVRFEKENKIVKMKWIKLQRLLNDGQTKSVFIDVKLPAEFDQAVLLFWNSGGQKPIVVSNIKVECFN